VIAVILPFYNNFDNTVYPLLDSIYRNTQNQISLYLVNDGSKEKFNLPANPPNITVKYIEHENYGYLKSANEAYKVASNDRKNDQFIFINSDTIVSPKWAYKLSNALFINKQIGIVCPCSNNSQQFSIYYNPKYTIEQWSSFIDKLIGNNSFGMYSRLPHGSCMLITRRCADAVMKTYKRDVIFDPIYLKGYGEENDFGMAAYKLGFLTFCAVNTFIIHKGKGSFNQLSENELQKLFLNARTVFKSRWSKDLSIPISVKAVNPSINAKYLSLKLKGLYS
jgi:GT2 family glycosyltransferase